MVSFMSFSSHFRNLVFGCFWQRGHQNITEKFIYFFTEQDKNVTHGNENLATYFWDFGSFDEKRSYENI